MRGIAFFTVLSAFAAVQASPLAVSDATVKPPVVGYVTFNKDVNGVITFGEHEDGLYMSHNSTHFSYHGNNYKNDKAEHIARDLDARQQSCDVSCQGSFGNAGDISSAINNLKNVFGGGFSYRGNVVQVVGNAFAFGCDYGNGQRFTSDQYSFDVACFQSRCGNTQGGWNSHHSWKSTYGVDVGSFSC